MKMKKLMSAALTVVITAVSMLFPSSAAAAKIAAPTKLTAKAKSTTAITLSWTASKEAEKYEIYYSNNQKTDFVRYGVTAKTTVTVSKLTAGTKYYFPVRSKATVDGKTVYSGYKAVSASTAAAKTDTAATLKITQNPGKVANNDTATLKAVGKPNTEYTLSVYYSTTVSKAKGTGKATSDKEGNVSWSWKVGAKTEPGEHKIVISGGGEKIETTFTTVK